jgi:multiple sugar transport system substrate-binding protein
LGEENVFMKIKSIISLFIILTLVFSVGACRQDGPDSEDALTVYVLSYDVDTQEAIAAFKEQHKDIVIKQKQFSYISEYKNSVVNDVLSGKGPDIIIDSFGQFTGKLLANKAYSDLNEMILEDKDFKKSDYNEKVLNLGVVQNKRYFIPLGYSVSALAASKKSLQSSGTEYIKGQTKIKALTEGAKKFTETNNGNKYLFDNAYTFTRFIENCGKNFIDYENKKALMNDSDFINALSAYKKVNTSVLPQNKAQENQNIMNYLDSGLCVTTTIDNCLKSGNVPENTPAGDKIELLNLPTFDSKAAQAKPEITVGINAACKNRKAAFDLIKLMLSEDIQSKNTFIAAPINKKAFDKKMKAAKNNSVYMKYIKDINTGINSISLYDSEIESIFEDNIKYFLNGGSTVEETAKSINAAVNKYLQEVTLSKNTDKAEKKKISIYCGNPNSIGLKMGIVMTKYNNTYKDSEMQKSMIFSEEGLATELMAGEGPDVMVMSVADMPSMNMLMKNGVFAELNTLISNDKDFNISDFNDNVMSCGVQGGKRYVIPMEYGVPILITTKSIREKNGIQINPSNWSLKSLAKAVKKFRMENSGKEKYFFYMMNEEYFGTMLESSGIDFVDYKNKKSNFNSPEFIDLLEIYKEFYMAACPQSVVSKYGSSECRLFQNDVCAVYNARSAGPHTCTAFGVFELWSSEVTVKYLMNEDVEVFALPDYYGKGDINGKPGSLLGINNKSTNKEEAFNFIKCVLSEDMQSRYTNAVPVHRPAYQKYVEMYTTNTGRSEWWVDDSTEFTPGPFRQEFSDIFTGMVNKISSGKLTDRSVLDIVYAELPDFVSGKKSASATSKTIHEKVSLLLNE